MMPPTPSCASKVSGNSAAAAVMMIRSKGACAGDRGDVVNPESGEALLRLLQQRPVALDGVDPPRQAREHRRLIAGARADLEHLVTRRHLECLGHQGDDLRLADGLALADGQRLILVGLVVE